MKHIAFFLLIISMILGPCTPSDSAIQTAIAETKAAQAISTKVPVKTPTSIVISSTSQATMVSVIATPTPLASGLAIDYAISFISGNEKKSQIEVMNVDGSKRLTIYKGILESFDWSPDGEQLALVEQEAQGVPQITILNVYTDNAKVLVQPEKILLGFNERYYAYSTPRFTADKGIFYLAWDPLRVGYEIRKISLAGKQQNLPPSIQQGGRNGLDVSQAGLVVYQTFGNAPPKFGNGLSVYDISSGKIIDTIPIQPISVGTPSWSPDGERIAFSASSTEKNKFEGPSSIWTIKKDGSDLQKVLSGESDFALEDPAWSPDGKWIAFSKARVYASREKGDSDIWIVSIDGKTIVNLTNTSDISETSPAWNPVQSSPCEPNDLHPYQWDMRAIDLVGALNQFPNCQTTPVQIAIIDTGVDAKHPDLEGQIVFTDTAIGDSAEDRNGHGTHVAGIIAAIQNNGIFIAGIHPNSQLSVYKYSDEWSDNMLKIYEELQQFGKTDHEIVANFIISAVDHGAKVINLSFGAPYDVALPLLPTGPKTKCTPYNSDKFTSCNGVLEKAIKYAEDHEPPVIIVAAAGEKPVDGFIYPAAYSLTYSNVIAVTASNTENNLADYSTPGSYITIAAPGGDGLPCLIEKDDCVVSLGLEGHTKELPGTSMAAPHVTGVVALMISANPNLINNPTDIRNILVCTATHIAPAPQGFPTNLGIVNASKAVQSAFSGIVQCTE